MERPFLLTVMRDIALAKKQKAEGASGTLKGEHLITKIQDFLHDPVFFSYCQDPHVLRVVEDIIGPDTLAIHTMLINKPPDLGIGSSRHPLHQDLAYFPHRPHERIVCAWTAMQTITRLNGCLCVDPGTHTGKLFTHAYPSDGVVNKAYHGIQGMSSEADTKNLLHLEMESGDTVFFPSVTDSRQWT